MIAGGREWPHRNDWAPKVGYDDQGINEAWIGKPSEKNIVTNLPQKINPVNVNYQ